MVSTSQFLPEIFCSEIKNYFLCSYFTLLSYVLGFFGGVLFVWSFFGGEGFLFVVWVLFFGVLFGFGFWL